MSGRNGLTRQLLQLSPARAFTRLLLIAALTICAVSTFAQASPIRLVSFGNDVTTRKPLVLQDGHVWIALADVGAALGPCNPVGGISGGKVILNDPQGRRIYSPMRKIAGDSYIHLSELCEAAGLSPVFDGRSGVYRIRRNLSRVEVTGGKIVFALPDPPRGCKLKRLDKPARAYFDIPATNLDTTFRSYRVGSGGIKCVRLGQNTPDTVRVVLDLASGGVADKLKLTRSDGTLDIVSPGVIASTQVPLSQAAESGPSTSDAGAGPTATAPGAQTPKKPAIELSSIHFEADESGNREIRILTSRATEPRARFLTDPPRLSLDFADTICGVDYPELLVDDTVVRGIRSGQFLLDPAIARVVLDLKKSVYYQMWYDEETGEMVIALEPPPATGGKLSDKTIVVDPGHGDKIVGARRVYGDTLLAEEKINLAIALKLEELLETEGVDVVMTRTDGSNLGDSQEADLAGRVEVAEDAEADIFVSIHCNATRPGSEHRKCGTETYYYSPRSFWLAEAVHSKMVSSLKTHDGGTRVARFHVLRNTSMPAVLAEVAYLSHPDDQERLADPEFLEKAAEAIFDGLKGYVEGSAWDSTPAAEATEDQAVEETPVTEGSQG